MRAIAVILALLVSCKSRGAVVTDDRPIDAGRTHTAEANDDGAAPAARWLEVYYPGWAMREWPPEAVDWSTATDVVLFGLVPAGDDVDLRGTGLDATRITIAARSARAAGAMVLISVGGERTGPRFRDALARGSSRLAERIARVVRAHALDGLVLDIEPLADVPPEALSAFVRSLRERLPPPVRLEAVVAPDPAEIARLAPVARDLDRVGIMTYLRALDAAEEQRLVERLPLPPERIALGPRQGTSRNAILWHAGSVCKARGTRPCRFP